MKLKNKLTSLSLAAGLSAGIGACTPPVATSEPCTITADNKAICNGELDVSRARQEYFNNHHPFTKWLDTLSAEQKENMLLNDDTIEELKVIAFIQANTTWESIQSHMTTPVFHPLSVGQLGVPINLELLKEMRIYLTLADDVPYSKEEFLKDVIAPTMNNMNRMMPMPISFVSSKEKANVHLEVSGAGDSETHILYDRLYHTFPDDTTWAGLIQFPGVYYNENSVQKGIFPLGDSETVSPISIRLPKFDRTEIERLSKDMEYEGGFERFRKNAHITMLQNVLPHELVGHGVGMVHHIPQSLIRSMVQYKFKIAYASNVSLNILTMRPELGLYDSLASCTSESMDIMWTYPRVFQQFAYAQGLIEKPKESLADWKKELLNPDLFTELVAYSCRTQLDNLGLNGALVDKFPKLSFDESDSTLTTRLSTFGNVNEELKLYNFEYLANSKSLISFPKLLSSPELLKVLKQQMFTFTFKDHSTNATHQGVAIGFEEKQSIPHQGVDLKKFMVQMKVTDTQKNTTMIKPLPSDSFHFQNLNDLFKHPQRETNVWRAPVNYTVEQVAIWYENDLLTIIHL